MHPVALTLKRTAKKYANPWQGELMLVHLCVECGKPSINRIAADDDIETVLKVFNGSKKIDLDTKSALARDGVTMLEAGQHLLVRERLLGRN